jgi:hypothetical protein
VIPQHQVDGKEQPGQDRVAAGGQPARSMPPLLHDGEASKHRYGEQAAVERGSGGTCVGKLDQDSRGGDARRAQAREQHRSAIAHRAVGRTQGGR